MSERGTAKRRWGLVAALGLIVVGGLLGLAAAWGGSRAVHATNTTEFCTSCHLYEDFAAEFKRSAHWSNTSGVQVQCHECHIPKDTLWNMLTTKASSGLAAFWAYFVAGLDTPEEFAEARPELQEVAHAWFQQNDAQTCRNCHAVESMKLEQQSAGARASHQALEEGGGTPCVACHSDVPHGAAPKPQSGGAS